MPKSRYRKWRRSLLVCVGAAETRAEEPQLQPEPRAPAARCLPTFNPDRRTRTNPCRCVSARCAPIGWEVPGSGCARAGSASSRVATCPPHILRSRCSDGGSSADAGPQPPVIKGSVTKPTNGVTMSQQTFRQQAKRVQPLPRRAALCRQTLTRFVPAGRTNQSPVRGPERLRPVRPAHRTLQVPLPAEQQGHGRDVEHRLQDHGGLRGPLLQRLRGLRAHRYRVTWGGGLIDGGGADVLEAAVASG